MESFIKGLDLCESFFLEVAKPILGEDFPDLPYSAGLLGYGSDVLGYDDETSTDHMWGPRFYLFLREQDIGLRADLLDCFARKFPYEYKGFSVNFSEPDPNDNGVRVAEKITEGRVSPLVFIHTIEDYLETYLGTSDIDQITGLDWLAFSEHRLLALTAGRIFVDSLGIQDKLDKLRFYPEEVRLFLIASNWSLIVQEQAFVRRCFDVGDDTGSALVCGRIADRLMRLAFLYSGKYAPYSKWFGTAFSRLPIDEQIKNSLHESVTAASVEQRESSLLAAQKGLADLHNETGLTEFVDVQIGNYLSRNIKVIHADKLVEATMKKLSGTVFEHFPLIGSVSSVPNFTSLFDDTKRQGNIKALYGAAGLG